MNHQILKILYRSASPGCFIFLEINNYIYIFNPRYANNYFPIGILQSKNPLSIPRAPFSGYRQHSRLGSLAEIEYASDVLKADGVGLLTSYGDHWLGDPMFRPVFEELNRRKAVVFVHPTVPVCCRTLLADVPPVIEEIPQDTARAITNLLYTGTLARFREIRFIFCHGGGTLPMVYGRMLQNPPKNLAERAPNGIDYELRKLYYDVAATAVRPAMAALTSLVPTSQILLGTDNPYVPAEISMDKNPPIILFHIRRVHIQDIPRREERQNN